MSGKRVGGIEADIAQFAVGVRSHAKLCSRDVLGWESRSGDGMGSWMEGNVQDGRSVTVCSRIQPPLSRRVCEREKDHLRFGMLPKIRGEKSRGDRRGANHCR